MVIMWNYKNSVKKEAFWVWWVSRVPCRSGRGFTFSACDWLQLRASCLFCHSGFSLHAFQQVGRISLPGRWLPRSHGLEDWKDAHNSKGTLVWGSRERRRDSAMGEHFCPGTLDHPDRCQESWFGESSSKVCSGSFMPSGHIPRPNCLTSHTNK